jgi:hypothetical protein
MHAIVTTPAEPPDPCHSSAITLAALADPMAAAFPITSVGRLPRQLFRGLLDVHSRYGLHTHRVAKRPFPPRASAVWLPTRPSRLLRGVMTTSPTGLSPAGLQRPFTAHDVNSYGRKLYTSPFRSRTRPRSVPLRELLLAQSPFRSPVPFPGQAMTIAHCSFPQSCPFSVPELRCNPLRQMARRLGLPDRTEKNL